MGYKTNKGNQWKPVYMFSVRVRFNYKDAECGS